MLLALAKLRGWGGKDFVAYTRSPENVKVRNRRVSRTYAIS
jgi:hypothetical protein